MHNLFLLLTFRRLRPSASCSKTSGDFTRGRLPKRLAALAAALAFLAYSAPADAAHGIALYGDLKYPANFSHFDYVNPAAPKGGTLKLSFNAAFDSVNPYILKGISAPGINGFLYQTLMTPSYDEPQSFYALIADSVTVAPDQKSAVFTLNPAARWHDGLPITADDVVFSFNILKEKGHPSYRVLYKPIRIEKLGVRKLRFTFEGETQRELPLIAASMPVLPQHYFAKIPFEKTTLTPPLGSGPYKIAAIDPGRTIVYTRIADYWAADLPSQKGLNNFDRIQFDSYRDDVVALEGIKSHQFDFYEEFIARSWATAYDIPAVNTGALIKTRIPHKIPRGMQAFLFNTRLAKFTDPRVRKAIGLTLDFEWMNKTLFYDAYERNSSYFNNTDFVATGLPSKQELALLEPYRQTLPPAVFDQEYHVPKTDGTGFARENLIRAQGLLNAAGWVMKNGRRVHAKTGEPLTVEFLMTQRTFERVVGIMRHNLLKLGIDSRFRYVDASQYQKRVDHRQFDIVSIWWNQGNFYPGNEQFTLWHSSQAEIEGSQNLGGIKNPAIDSLVEKIRHARTLEELQPVGRALDRVLLQEHYAIPHWNINAWRVLYWDQFGRPEITPAYNIALDSWWAKEAASPRKNISGSITESPATRDTGPEGGASAKQGTTEFPRQGGSTR